MKTTITFLAGVAAAWAALAIWQHRAIPDIDPADVPPVRPRFDDASVDPLRGGCSGFGGGR